MERGPRRGCGRGPVRDAQLALLAAGRFTVGSVLEQQADAGPPGPIDHDSVFEAGLAFVTDGLAQRAGLPPATT